MSKEITRPTPARLSSTGSLINLNLLTPMAKNSKNNHRLSTSSSLSSTSTVVKDEVTFSIRKSSESYTNSSKGSGAGFKPTNNMQAAKNKSSQPPPKPPRLATFIDEGKMNENDFIKRRQKVMTKEQIKAYEYSTDMTHYEQLIRLSMPQVRVATYIKLLEEDPILSNVKNLIDMTGNPILSWFRSIRERFIGVYFTSCKDKKNQHITEQLVEITEMYQQDIAIVCVFFDGSLEDQLKVLRSTPNWLAIEPPRKKRVYNLSQAFSSTGPAMPLNTDGHPQGKSPTSITLSASNVGMISASQAEKMDTKSNLIQLLDIKIVPSLAVIDSTKSFIYSKDCLDDILENPNKTIANFKKAQSQNTAGFSSAFNWLFE
ncbi:hypothetical protein H4219_005949 [Mycoemilia scoparia]|uniref:Uncharacterized protein n=1 Tax=Mycoemilia scoparia TaxID=417184 RepID=A0A9W7ZRN7_9FUNG|nr:hypothetical protein H4219_005949 [Mycoemilia scoparia]